MDITTPSPSASPSSPSELQPSNPSNQPTPPSTSPNSPSHPHSPAVSNPNPTTPKPRTLPTLLASIARDDPSRIFCSYPRTAGSQSSDNAGECHGLRDVTYVEFARGVQRCARFLRGGAELGGGVDGGEYGKGGAVVAYLGPADLRYQMLVVAGMRVGVKIFLPSPKNSPETQLALLDQIDCQRLIVTSPPVPTVGEILARRRMGVRVLGGLEELLESGVDGGVDGEVGRGVNGVVGGELSTAPASGTSSDDGFEAFEGDMLRSVVLMQTSGSTSRWPKVVELKNGWFTAPDVFQASKPTTWADLLRHRRVLIALPPFHSAGLALTLSLAIYYNMHTILPHPDTPITAETVHSFRTLPHDRHIHGCMISPSTVLEMQQTPQGLSDAQHLEFIGFGGGSLPKGATAALQSRTRLVNNIGSTETAPLFSEPIPDPRYFRFDARLGVQFREGFNGFHEMVVVRDERLAGSQAVFTTFPELDEYRTKDLYVPHPTEEGMWAYHGRADDVIVFSNGEKLHPGAIEEAVGLHPEVSAALVEGNARFQAALLVEPRTFPRGESGEREFVERIWPVVRAACGETAAHGRIAQDLVLVARADKPFLRTAKGSVRRGVTLDEYREELDGLRQGNDSSEVNGNEPVKESDASSGCIDKVRSVAADEIGRPVGDAENLLGYGVDSLQVANITRRINKSLGESLEVKDIYERQNIQDIAGAIAKDGPSPKGEDSSVDKMKTLVNDLSSSIILNARPAEPLPEKATVILTGSTGSLGTYILDSLLRSPHIAKIYCLNRSQDAQQRQLTKLEDYGLTTRIASTKCTWLKCDLASPGLGVSKRHYRELLDTATTIVHNAWEVNFNLPLSSFERDHLGGVRNIVNFSQCSRFGARMLFMSSVGVALGWKGNDKSSRVPERVLDDWTAPEGMGYAQSKFVAERVLDEARRSADANVTVVRLGQLAGPALREQGIWTRQEWFPSVVDTSMMMGVVPGDLGSMSGLDWIPVDVCADMVVELVERSFKLEDGMSDDGMTKHLETVSDFEDGYVEVITAEHILQRPLRYWTGMDVDEVHQTLEAQTEVLHLVNPRSMEWSKLLPSVLEHFPSNFETVPFPEWVQELKFRLGEQDDSTGSSLLPDPAFSDDLHGSDGASLANGTAKGERLDVENTPSSFSHRQRATGMELSVKADLPAARLLSFFEGLTHSAESKAGGQFPTFETRETRDKCVRLRNLQPVCGEWMHRWMRQWGYLSDTL